MTPQRVLAVIFTVAFVGCAGKTNDATGRQVGTPGGPCYGNDTCNGGLACRAGLCEPVMDAGNASGGAGNTGGRATGGYGGGDGGAGNAGAWATGGYGGGDGGGHPWGLPAGGTGGGSGGTEASTGGAYPGTGGAGGGTGGQPGLSVQCGGSTCTAKQFPLSYQSLSPDGSRTALACCTGPGWGRCGLLVAGGCTELAEPGKPSAQCRGMLINPGPNQASFDGCCKPDGTCGLADTALGLDCFFSPTLGANSTPDWCAPDAGP
jgi:hypothetical protein